MKNCENCGSAQIEELNHTINEVAPMSDGKIVKNFQATRFICRNCAILSTAYNPEDRLLRYFREEYDVSDLTQNNRIIVKGKMFGKHDEIHEQTLDFFKDKESSLNDILEVACGRGELLVKLAKQNPKAQCLGVDPSLDANLEAKEKNVAFVSDYYHRDKFEENGRDLIVAHGFLNRIETYPTLKSFQKILRVGGYLSIEVAHLESSPFAPHIWDHSYTYSKETFLFYLRHLGFKLEKEMDCVSTTQYVLSLEKKSDEVLKLPLAFYEENLKMYNEHLKYWEKIKENVLKMNVKEKGKRISLFGAGLYNAVLLHLLDEAPSCVIDEFRTGDFNGLPLVDLAKATELKDEMEVALCIRRNSVDFVEGKLRESGIGTTVVC